VLTSPILEEIELLDARMKRSKQRATEAAEASGTALIDVYRIGPIIAATIIGYTGDITLLPTSGPLRRLQRGRTDRVLILRQNRARLSRCGNRTLNHAIHMVAVTQIRHLHSGGRSYFDRKVAEGRTKREAMRALKRQISDRVCRHLTADARNK
jgi:transposase